MSLAMRSVFGSFLYANGLPASGQVDFHLTGPLQDTVGNVLLTPKPLSLPVASGELDGVLAVTEGPGLAPVGPRYRVIFRLVGLQPGGPFFLSVPAGATPLPITDFEET